MPLKTDDRNLVNIDNCLKTFIKPYLLLCRWHTLKKLVPETCARTYTRNLHEKFDARSSVYCATTGRPVSWLHG